jgi:radical SAM superfamily enzyme YgiQ (UPF0313 family)
MKIALVQSPVWWTIDPPLGLAQMAGCLKAAGHEVRVWDLNIRLWSNRLPQYESMWLWEQSHFWNQPSVVDRFFADNRSLIENEIQDLLSSDSGIVGFSIYGGSCLTALKIAAEIKKADPGRTIVFGGQYFFLGDTARRLLEESACVDAVVRGSGETVFPQLAEDLSRGGLRPRPGLLFRAPEGIVDGGPSTMPKNLYDLPFADFTGFPMELYSDKTRIPIAASRGCIWACRFCSTREFWEGYSYMSGERIFAEVRHQKSLFPGRAHFEFYDITANGRPESLATFSELAKDFIVPHLAEKNFKWKINAVLRPEMTAGLLKLMYEGGCQDVIYGVESGSPAVLKRMNKHFNLDVAERVLRDTHEAGIRTTANFMFGFPGETEADFEMTLNFLRRNHRWLDRAYGSATFTSLEEFSFLTEHQKEFGIRPEPEGGAHHLYWESEDGANTYPVRLDRYRRFRRVCAELGIDAYKGVNGTLEQDRLANLAHYHEYRDHRLEAVSSYMDYLELDLSNEPIRVRLRGYIDELDRLHRAARLVERANSLLGSLNGHGKGPLRDLAGIVNRDEAVPPVAWNVRMKPDEAAFAWIQRYLVRAQNFLRRLRQDGAVRWTEGRFQVIWGKGPVAAARELSVLHSKARMMVRLSAAEAARPPAERHVPNCAR